MEIAVNAKLDFTMMGLVKTAKLVVAPAKLVMAPAQMNVFHAIRLSISTYQALSAFVILAISLMHLILAKPALTNV